MAEPPWEPLDNRKRSWYCIRRFAMERQKKIVPVAVAVILDKDLAQVLLQRREYTTGVEGLDGMWELPGGKIEFGEKPDQTVRREIMEELDCSIRVVRLLPHIQTNIWRFPEFDGHGLLIGYHCRIIDKGPRFDINGIDRRWFDIGQINFTTTLPGTREFIESVF